MGVHWRLLPLLLRTSSLVTPFLDLGQSWVTQWGGHCVTEHRWSSAYDGAIYNLMAPKGAHVTVLCFTLWTIVHHYRGDSMLCGKIGFLQLSQADWRLG